jgi:hypothetical protein
MPSTDSEATVTRTVRSVDFCKVAKSIVSIAPSHPPIHHPRYVLEVLELQHGRSRKRLAALPKVWIGRRRGLEPHGLDGAQHDGRCCRLCRRWGSRRLVGGRCSVRFTARRRARRACLGSLCLCRWRGVGVRRCLQRLAALRPALGHGLGLVAFRFLHGRVCVFAGFIGGRWHGRSSVAVGVFLTSDRQARPERVVEPRRVDRRREQAALSGATGKRRRRDR